MKRWYIWFFSVSAAGLLFWTLTILFRSDPTEPLSVQNPVVVVMKSVAQPMDFWTVVGMGISEASREFGIPIYITGPSHEREIDLQLRIFQSALQQNPPLIILVASDFERLREPVEQAQALGIPVITMDSAVNSDIPITFVGTDNIEAGFRSGEHMGRLMKEFWNPGPVAIVSHIQETATGIDRERGVREALSQAGIPVAGTWFAEVDQQIAYEITYELLDNPEITGFIALNETTTLGMAQAIADRGAHDRVIALGFDNAPPILSFMEQGVLRSTVVQRPYNMGYLAVRAASDFLRGRRVPQLINTGSLLITPENMFEREYQELLFPFADTM